MSRFSTDRDAKEYLAAEIVREAAREGRPLSDIEQKMLYFSESGWTLPNMTEIAEKFGQQCDVKEYERKVTGIARSAREHANKAGRAAWSEAVARLELGDHYLLVMLRHASGRQANALTWREAVAVILLIVGLGAVWPLVLTQLLGHFPTKDDQVFFTWVALIVLAGAYLFARFAAGRARFEGWLNRAVEWFARGRRR